MARLYTFADMAACIQDIDRPVKAAVAISHKPPLAFGKLQQVGHIPDVRNLGIATVVLVDLWIATEGLADVAACFFIPPRSAHLL
jgi:hypothetical protein